MLVLGKGPREVENRGVEYLLHSMICRGLSALVTQEVLLGFMSRSIFLVTCADVCFTSSTDGGIFAPVSGADFTP